MVQVGPVASCVAQVCAPVCTCIRVGTQEEGLKKYLKKKNK